MHGSEIRGCLIQSLSRQSKKLRPLLHNRGFATKSTMFCSSKFTDDLFSFVAWSLNFEEDTREIMKSVMYI